MLYLALESVGCISGNVIGKDVNMLQTCGSQVVPQFSICWLLTTCLFLRFFIAPLTTASISIKQAAEFTGISLTLKIQLLCVASAAFYNTILFALMKDGPTTTTIVVMTALSLFSLWVAVCTETISIVKHGQLARRASTNEASHVIEAVLRSSSSIGADSIV
jgi:small-conductance mechanosensitive channel